MNTYVQQLWIDALPHYVQGKGMLRYGDCFCIGGVLCDLHSQATGLQWEQDSEGWSYLDVGAVPPKEVLLWAQLREDDLLSIMEDNDKGITFPELAERIAAL